MPTKKPSRFRPRKQQQNKPGQKKAAPKHSSHRRHQRRARPRMSQTKLLEKAEKGHLNLLEEHLQARKKYFDFFHRADPKQLLKLKNNFYRSLEKLRQFEASIGPELKKYFVAKLDGFKRDTVYSERRKGTATEILPSAQGAANPHFLPSQMRDSGAPDTRESTGTLEDYLNYKGLPPDHFEQQEKQPVRKRK